MCLSDCSVVFPINGNRDVTRIIFVCGITCRGNNTAFFGCINRVFRDCLCVYALTFKLRVGRFASSVGGVFATFFEQGRFLGPI